jgi:hypothetical protein
LAPPQLGGFFCAIFWSSNRIASELPELIESLLVYSKLVQDSIEERRSDLSPTVNWDRRCSPVRMTPSFVTPGLARF